MTVYVDDMRLPATVGNIKARWSHLFADTSDELREFATRLGLRPEWIQRPGTHREHYDVTDRVRERALVLGAEHLSYPRGTGAYIARKRDEQHLTETAGNGSDADEPTGRGSR